MHKRDRLPLLQWLGTYSSSAWAGLRARFVAAAVLLAALPPAHAGDLGRQITRCRDHGSIAYTDQRVACAQGQALPIDPDTSSGLDGGRHRATRTEGSPIVPQTVPRAGGRHKQRNVDARCKDLEHRLRLIDDRAALPGTGSRQDKLRVTRMQVRAEQGKLGCR